MTDPKSALTRDVLDAIKALDPAEARERGDMKPFSEELSTIIFNGFRDVPEGQMAHGLRNEALAFWDRSPKPSLAQQYDYLQNIADTGCCQISSSVRVLCDLKRFYSRPKGNP